MLAKKPVSVSDLQPLRVGDREQASRVVKKLNDRSSLVRIVQPVLASSMSVSADQAAA
jgi:hypothetical protein